MTYFVYNTLRKSTSIGCSYLKIRKEFEMKKLFADDRGQDLIEYALMAAFVAIAALVIIPDVSHGLWLQVVKPIVEWGPETQIRVLGILLALFVLRAIIKNRRKQNEKDEG